VGTVYSDYSGTASATTSGPPAAPSNLAATATSASSISLTWTDNATDEQFYRIERSTDGISFAQVALLSANTTAWSNTGLSAATTYYYRVRVSAGTIYSGYSNVASATTSPPPAAPSSLGAQVLSPTSIKLTWTDNSGDEQYFRVERSADGVSFTQVAIVLANSTTWTNSSLAPATAYHYRVRASAGTVYSAYSNVVSATTDPPPEAPSNLQAALSGTSVVLTWTDNASNEQYFRVERSTDGVSFTQVAVLLANKTTWTNYFLTPGTTYHYRVRVSIGSVYSEYSETVAVTIPGP
jgi:fibronectin type 3 domain-containing protein